eukprot:Gb_11595 [translate_table: standard]
MAQIPLPLSALHPSSSKLINGLRRFNFNTKPSTLTPFASQLHRMADGNNAVNTVFHVNRISCVQSSTSHVSRRTGNHHPNLWDDHFIQSLDSTPSYQHEANSVRAESLISEIKDMFGGLMGEGDNDLLEHLVMVDDLERLGIDGHFQKEIKVALDYVYRYWNHARGIGRGRKSVVTDLNTTAVGLRLLRLHRYHVSPDNVLDKWRDESGHFKCCEGERDGTDVGLIRSMLNLFRVSLLAFPGEKVMDEAKLFAANFLKQLVAKADLDVSSANLLQEVKYALEYTWHNNLPGFEARSFIDAYAGQSTAIGNQYQLKCLELAKLEFNMLQSLHQKEMQLVSRWWTESVLAELTFARHRHVEYYFWAAAATPEPGFSTYRIALAKIATLATVVDDIYDTYGTLDELKLFTEAVRRWDLSMMECLPEYMRICFRELYQTVNELACQAQKTQGREMLNYIRRAWEIYIGAYLQEAEWIAAQHVPTWEEYIENGINSSGLRTLTLHCILLLNEPLTDNILREVDMPSKFHRLVQLTARLRGDARTFKVEKARGEVASSIACYMKDNPGCTEEDALKHIEDLYDHSFKELNWEFLKPDEANNDSLCETKKHAFNLARGLQFFYTHGDGLSVSSTRHISTILIEPII